MTLTSKLTIAIQFNPVQSKQHVCPVRTCNKSFSTSGNLSRHKRMHSYIEPLPCPVDGCVCTFSSNNKLAKHMRFHFGSDDVKVCVVSGCGKTFSTTGNLNRHLKAAHGQSYTFDNERYSSSSETSSSDESASEIGCCSPLGFSRSDAPAFASPNGTDHQWFVRDFVLPRSEETTWTFAPISFSEPPTEPSDADLVDALSVLFNLDEPAAIAKN